MTAAGRRPRRPSGEHYDPGSLHDEAFADVNVPRRHVEALGRALRGACGGDDPRIVLLTDGPGNTAFREHRLLADLLGIELVTLAELDVEAVDVVYRRTEEDRLQAPDGSLTRIGAALLPGPTGGGLAVVNAIGNGVADDTLVHAHVGKVTPSQGGGGKDTWVLPR